MYNANIHSNWAGRMTELVRVIYQSKQEIEKLDAIYTNEAESGSHSDFGDTSVNTEQELIDGVTAARAIKTTIVAQESNITPFLTGE